MKRWLVVLLVVLAVVILVSPGIIGRLAEKNFEQNLLWATSDSSGIEIETESFERGWFTSEGRHRVLLNSSVFQEDAANYRLSTGNEELPSLLIDTRLEHGLVPVGDAGSLAPGLANMLSTFRIDPGNGELFELPGSLRSKVGLSGASDSRFLLEADRYENEEGHIEWGGADIALQTDWSDGTLIVAGRIEPITIGSDDDTLRIGAMTVTADQARGGYGFNVGTASLSLESIVAESPGNPVTVGVMAFSAGADIEDARLNFNSNMSVEEFMIPTLGEVSFVLDLAVSRLDAASMQVITQAFREAQESPDPQQAVATVMPKIEQDLQKLLTAGAEIRIDQLDVSLPQGKLTTNLRIDIPEGDAGASFSWASVLLAMTASADLRMPTALFDMIITMNPQANALVAMGVLQRDGDDYIMNAEYAQGLLNVNGAPMPVPIPGM